MHLFIPICQSIVIARDYISTRISARVVYHLCFFTFVYCDTVTSDCKISLYVCLFTFLNDWLIYSQMLLQ